MMEGEVKADSVHHLMHGSHSTMTKSKGCSMEFMDTFRFKVSKSSGLKKSTVFEFVFYI